MLNKDFFEKNPIWKSLFIVGGFSSFLALMNFDRFEIFVSDVIIISLIIVVYFDGRIEKIENHLKRKKYKSFMNKKGMTQLTLFVVSILLILLFAYLSISYFSRP